MHRPDAIMSRRLTGRVSFGEARRLGEDMIEIGGGPAPQRGDPLLDGGA